MNHKFKKARKVTEKEKIYCGGKPEAIIPEKPKVSAGIKKYECKRGKGKHIFEIVPKNQKKHKYDSWIEYKCKFCGKEEYRIISMGYKKTSNGYYTKKEPKKCPICGKEVIPDLESLDKKGLWDEHTFKYNCNCHNKDLRVSIG
jgi:rubrerythrin